MAEKVTKEDAEVLVTRNPTPKVERSIQTLEVDAGAPPAPEKAKPETKTDASDVQKELEALRAKVAEYKEVLPKKDAAIAEAKAAAEAAKKLAEQSNKTEDKEDTGDPDISALMAEERRKTKAELREELLAEIRKEKESDPDLQAAKGFRAEREYAKAEEDWGKELAAQYKDAAEEQRKSFPGMSLSQAYNLVVPRGTETAPATPVESARSPAPTQGVDRGQLAQEKLAEARALRGRSDGLRKSAMLEDFVKLQAPGIFPDRGGG